MSSQQPNKFGAPQKKGKKTSVTIRLPLFGSTNLIVKLLNLYTPADDFEERVPLSFIRKVQQRLKERAGTQDQSTLLMDTKFNFPVRFPFKPSPIQLEEIEIPEVLNLPMLKKV